MKQKLFSKDFTLVVIGQIISLFGNATIRFALPLYLLNLTGSSALYGTVTACAFIPAILLSLVGGIVADRVNKRNIMVVLDFITAAIIIAFSLLMNEVNLILLLTVTLMLLYGIAGAYQPSVQASIPALVEFHGGKFHHQYCQLFRILNRSCTRRHSIQCIWIRACIMGLLGVFYLIGGYGNFHQNTVPEASFKRQHMEDRQN